MPTTPQSRQRKKHAARQHRRPAFPAQCCAGRARDTHQPRGGRRPLLGKAVSPSATRAAHAQGQRGRNVRIGTHSHGQWGRNVRIGTHSSLPWHGTRAEAGPKCSNKNLPGRHYSGETKQVNHTTRKNTRRHVERPVLAGMHIRRQPVWQYRSGTDSTDAYSGLHEPLTLGQLPPCYQPPPQPIPSARTASRMLTSPTTTSLTKPG